MDVPFDKPLYIIETLQKNHFQAYFVGGSVRDLLLGREIGDIDIATSAKPDEVMQLFPKTIDVGAQHGTVIVLHEGEPFEVTTFRTEGKYEDYRRPSQVAFIAALEEDLKRRDFTVNAIAMDTAGKIIDPFGGKEDLHSSIIRTVGHPGDRFTEDALRMMRAVRFVSQLSFSLDNETKEAIILHGSLLRNVSIERITIEFEKLLKGPNCRAGLSLLFETGLNEYLPGLSSEKQFHEEFSGYQWNLLKQRHEYWGMAAAILGWEEGTLRRWKLPVSVIKEAQQIRHWLGRLGNGPWSTGMLYEAGIETALSTERVRCILSMTEDCFEPLHSLREKWAGLPIKSRKDLEAGGKDLMAWMDRGPGPWIEEMLKMAEQGVLSGSVLNKKDQLKEWLLSCNQK